MNNVEVDAVEKEKAIETKMKTSQEYFNMGVEELQEVMNEHGYTREDNKILDEGLRVHFFENKEIYDSLGVDCQLFFKSQQDLDLKEVLLMTTGRIAMIFD